jgi:GAF domain-containing protein
VIGTFAIYHSTARAPTEEEILAIKGISGHVARALASFR